MPQRTFLQPDAQLWNSLQTLRLQTALRRKEQYNTIKKVKNKMWQKVEPARVTDQQAIVSKERNRMDQAIPGILRAQRFKCWQTVKIVLAKHSVPECDNERIRKIASVQTSVG